jgi:hypothetical protein
MEISQEMKDCLMLAMEDGELDFQETVYEGFRIYHSRNNGPIEVEDEDEALELTQKCFSFVLDVTLSNLVLAGAVEIAGMEDGEFVYAIPAGFDVHEFLMDEENYDND